MSDKPIPTILDTDIGGDIDDTWALAFLLACPEVDLRMVSTDTGNTLYRAKIAAKLLELAGRSDVPVAVGVKQNQDEQGQAAWVADYDLVTYPGHIYDDGVTALIEAILGADEPVTLVCIGPVPNIALALKKEPEIAKHARFVGMHGSIRRGVMGAEGAVAEYNVVADAAAAQAVFAAPWIDMTITPLDTCGQVMLREDLYASVRDSEELLPRMVMENYRAWSRANNAHDPEKASSVLFDTVAAYLVFATEFLRMERAGVRVTDDGHTVLDPDAQEMSVAMDWADLPGFEKLLVDRLLAGVAG